MSTGAKLDRRSGQVSPCLPAPGLRHSKRPARVDPIDFDVEAHAGIGRRNTRNEDIAAGCGYVDIVGQPFARGYSADIVCTAAILGDLDIDIVIAIVAEFVTR